MLLCYGDRARHARIAGRVIGERASRTKGELERLTAIDGAAVKYASRIGRDRMRGGIVVCPRDSRTDFHRQRIRLEASTGDGYRVADRSRNCLICTRRRSLGRRRSMRGFNVLGRSSGGTRGRFFAA